MTEMWKPIAGYEGHYEASSFGRIRSVKLKNRTFRVLKGGKDKNGYILYVLCQKGFRKTFRGHRLIAETFIPNPYGYDQINHRDENVANNNIDNLEWCSVKYNNNYGNHCQNISKSLRNHLKKSRPVVQLDMNKRYVARYPSAKEAQRQTHICNISSACNKSFKHITSGGYFWEWEDNYKQLKF